MIARPYHSRFTSTLLWSLLFVFLTRSNRLSSTHALSSMPSKGTEIRICHDRDCLTDGAVEAKTLVEKLVQGSSKSKSSNAKPPITVTTCGCLGPCGKGPSVDVRIDGVRVKDQRVGQSNYYCFRNINSPRAAADMLQQAGIVLPSTVVEKLSSDGDDESLIVSTRKFWDFDRTTRIALQRLLYVSVALPLADADQNGTWDQIHGVVYPNSYAAIVAIVFVGSQFMGTGSKANSMNAGE
jgi:(2Fe-2S) ferredoxin